MGNLFGLLGAETPPKTDQQLASTLKLVETWVGNAVTIFLSLCAALILFYAIYIGWQLAKAEDDGKRKNAKAQLIYAIIGMISIALIVVIVKVAIPAAGVNLEAKGSGMDKTLVTTYAVINVVINSVLTIITSLVVVFAIWIGWKFMTAEDDGKRKNAKMQLIYTIIGVVAILLIQVLASVILNAVTPAVAP